MNISFEYLFLLMNHKVLFLAQKEKCMFLFCNWWKKMRKINILKTNFFLRFVFSETHMSHCKRHRKTVCYWHDFGNRLTVSISMKFVWFVHAVCDQIYHIPATITINLRPNNIMRRRMSVRKFEQRTQSFSNSLS